VTASVSVSRDDLFALVDRRSAEVRAFLEWAAPYEQPGGGSMRHDQRPDIADADRLTNLFPERWWGVVVFTCFGRDSGTEDVANSFQWPLPAEEAADVLARIAFRRPAIGHHRIQAGIVGAKGALISACDLWEEFRAVLFGGGTFEDRYTRLRALRARQWGRTTLFDLLLRAGALGVGDTSYAPTRAYLAGSTGPSKGFRRIFDTPVTNTNADWCEAVLAAWSTHWDAVARRVGTEWPGPPYVPADFENTLCIFQER
jgi:hypothetical protein